jgi:hypothetical protein
MAVTDSFTIAVNNYRASGSGGYSMLLGAPVVYDRGESIRNLLITDVVITPSGRTRALVRLTGLHGREP